MHLPSLHTQAKIFSLFKLILSNFFLIHYATIMYQKSYTYIWKLKNYILNFLQTVNNVRNW